MQTTNKFSPIIKIVKGTFFSRIYFSFREKRQKKEKREKKKKSAKMLSFEEDFQNVYIKLNPPPPPLTQKSQSGAEFFSHFFSILLKTGLYPFAVELQHTKILFYISDQYFLAFWVLSKNGHNAKTDQRKQYIEEDKCSFGKMEISLFIYHPSRDLILVYQMVTC